MTAHEDRGSLKRQQRDSGIAVLGPMPWGTHFCQFYRTPDDLLDVIVPFLAAGLDGNEMCAWVTSSPLDVDSARGAMAERIPGIGEFLERGQLEIFPHTDWYLKDGHFDMARVLGDWQRMHDAAIAAGYEGIRVTGNTAWLEKEDWAAFQEYEHAINDSIEGARILVLCTYPEHECRTSEIIDVVASHDFALVRRDGSWERIETADRRLAREALEESEARYLSLFRNLDEGFAYHKMVTDESGRPVDYIFLEVNSSFEQLTGLKADDVLGRTVREVLPGIEDDPAGWIERYGRVALGGQSDSFEQYSDVLGRWYSVTAYCPEKGYFAAIFRDISEDRIAAERLLRENREIELVNRILELLVGSSGDRMFDGVLDLLLDATGSGEGAFGYIDPDGDLVCPTMTRVFDRCEMEDKCVRYPRDEWKGLWGRAITDGRAYSSNGPINVPAGHVPIDNNLASPVLFRGEVIGLFNLANKPGGYDDGDRETLAAIADRIAPALYVWIQKEAKKREHERAEAALRESREDLKRAQAVAQTGSWRLDVRRDELIWSDESYRIFGIAPGTAMTYESFLACIHPEDREDVDSKWAAALRGEPYDVEHRIIVGGDVKWVRERAELEFDKEGNLLGGFGTVQDITSRKHIEEELRLSREEISMLYEQEQSSRAEVQDYAVRLSLLHEVGLSLNDETDRDRLLTKILEGAIGMTRAGVGALLLVNDGRSEMAALRYASWYGSPCEIVDDASGLHKRIEELVAGNERNAVRISDISDEDNRFRFPEGHPRLRGLLVGVLRGPKGRTKGYFLLSDKEAGENFSSQDEEVVSLLAAQSSVALTSQEIYEREHQVAATLQSALLPDVPRRDDLDIGLLYQSADKYGKVGGDFYDIIDLGDGRVALAVGDVCGKGLEAATYTAMIKYVLRAYLLERSSPADCLERLNRIVGRELPNEKFVTLALAVFDPRRARLELVSAGHPRPVIVANGQASLIECDPAVPLGVLDDYGFCSTRVPFQGGSSLLMYTDGLLEARPEYGEPFGEERILAALRGAGRMWAQDAVTGLMADAVSYSEGYLRDDIALMMARIPPARGIPPA